MDFYVGDKVLVEAVVIDKTASNNLIVKTNSGVKVLVTPKDAREYCTQEEVEENKDATSGC